jgi:peptide/nickel transport system permease protein
MVAVAADPEIAGGAREARRARAGRRATGTGPLHWWAPGLLAGLTLVLVIAPVLLGPGEREVVGAPFTDPLDGHLLGTDGQGRDMLARLVLGLRTSWLAALAVIGIGVVIGAVVGLVAGFAGGWLDTVIMRVTDAALAVPGPLVALAVAAALGAGLRNTLLAVAATWWPWYARIVRGQVVSLVNRPHVEAARLGELGRVRTAVVHVLPGTVGPVVVAASLDVGAVMLVLAGLSFLGLGSPAPAAELGAMTAQGMTYLFNAPWVAIVPAAGLFGLAVLANLAGDGLRDLVAEHQ